jgi:phenylacetate-CoA ligase
VDPNAIRDLQARKLDELLRRVLASNPFYSRKLRSAGFDPVQLDRPRRLGEVLAALPLTTKAELEADQAAAPPYGTNLSAPLAEYTRVHRTSGSSGRPLYWLDTPASWQWFVGCWKRVYGAFGLQDRDRILFPFSFGPFLGFWGAWDAARELGCFCLAAGGMSSSARLRAVFEHEVSVVVATPTYALHLVEAARREGLDLAGSPVRGLIVAGEPGGSIPATRSRIEAGWGARSFDHSGMTEVGAFSFECPRCPTSLHFLEDEFIAEVLAVGSEARVAPGEVGELVVTNLGRVDSPVIRYRTGDLVRWTEEPCGCGRGGRFLGGILGRADDMVHVRGVNVLPAAIEAVVRGFAEVAEYRARVLQSRPLAALVLEIEPEPTAAGERCGSSSDMNRDLAARVEKAVRDALSVRPEVRLVPPGTLPRFEMKASRLVRE